MHGHEPRRPFRVRNVAEQPARGPKGDAGPRPDVAARIEKLAELAAAGLPLFGAADRCTAEERGERVGGGR